MDSLETNSYQPNEEQRLGGGQGEGDSQPASQPAAIELKELLDIVRRQAPRRIFRIRGNRQDYEDLLQDEVVAWCDHHQNRPSACERDGRSPSDGFDTGEIVRIIENRLGTLRRECKRMRFFDSESESCFCRHSPIPELTVDARRTLRRVQRWLDTQATDPDRELFQKLFLDGCPVERLCSELEVSPGCLYARISRLRKLLRRYCVVGTEAH